MLWAWGMAGAFVYAANTLILKVWNAEGRGERARAVAEFVVALATGALFAQGFGELFRAAVASGVTFGGFSFKADVQLVPAGLTVGWASNYLWPRILKRLGEAVDKTPTRRSRG